MFEEFGTPCLVQIQIHGQQAEFELKKYQLFDNSTYFKNIIFSHPSLTSFIIKDISFSIDTFDIFFKILVHLEKICQIKNELRQQVKDRFIPIFNSNKLNLSEDSRIQQKIRKLISKMDSTKLAEPKMWNNIKELSDYMGSPKVKEIALSELKGIGGIEYLIEQCKETGDHQHEEQMIGRTIQENEINLLYELIKPRKQNIRIEKLGRIIKEIKKNKSELTQSLIEFLISNINKENINEIIILCYFTIEELFKNEAFNRQLNNPVFFLKILEFYPMIGIEKQRKEKNESDKIQNNKIENMNREFQSQKEVQREEFVKLSQANQQIQQDYDIQQQLLRECQAKITTLISQNEEKDNKINEQVTLIQNAQERINEMQTQIARMTQENIRIESMYNQIDQFREFQNRSRPVLDQTSNILPFLLELSPKVFKREDAIGIIGSEEQKWNNKPSERTIIYSQGRGSLLFSTAGKNNFNFRSNSIDIYFDNDISITGIRFQGKKNAMPPWSFYQIDLHNEEHLLFNQEQSINDFEHELTFPINAVSSSHFRLKKDNNEYIGFKQFELLSNETKYQNGVFKTLIEETGNMFTAPYIIDGHDRFFTYKISTNGFLEYPGELHKPAYFCIDFLKKKVLLREYKVVREQNFCQKEWKLMATNKENARDEEWDVISQIEERNENELGLTSVFPTNASQFYRFFKFISNNPIWNQTSSNELRFLKVEFYGLTIDINENTMIAS